jgi:hypothetical protein
MLVLIELAESVDIAGEVLSRGIRNLLVVYLADDSLIEEGDKQDSLMGPD